MASRLSLLASAVICIAAPLAAQTTDRASVSTGGTEGDLASFSCSISANGSAIAFVSDATTLVAGDANGVADVFVRDFATGVTERVSVTSGGAEGHGACGAPRISGDGRFVAFESHAADLVAGDLNGVCDVFLRDRLNGTTVRVSVDSGGIEGNADSHAPSISADGRYVVFESAADNLVAADGNGARDVFVHDRVTGTTVRVSVDSLGAEAGGDSFAPSISAEGRFVAFESAADDLVAGDSNLKNDVFVHDRLLGTTVRASFGISLQEPNDHCSAPSISADGRLVAFESAADNLAPTDLNAVTDVFVHDLLQSVTSQISVSTGGLGGDLESRGAQIVSGGRIVVFVSLADDLVTGDLNGAWDVFVHNRLTGATTRLSVDGAGLEVHGDSVAASISTDGRYCAFQSGAADLVTGDLNGVDDVFRRDRGPTAAVGVDSIVLGGEVFFAVGAPVRLNWCNAPPAEPWWLLFSLNNSGVSFGAHPFGLGPNVKVLATGTVAATGSGTLLTPSIPPPYAGKTLYLELASQIAGDFRESNTVQRIVQ